MKRLILLFTLVLGLFSYSISFGQSCTSNPLTISSSTNFSQLSWSGANGITSSQCAQIAAGTLVKAANFTIQLGSSVTVVIDQNVTITGNFTLTNSGTKDTLDIPQNITLTVTGNMGSNTNNNIGYRIDGSLVVGGTLLGRNQNGLVGTGNLTADSIYFKTNATVSSTITYNVTSCNINGGSTSTACGTIAAPVELSSFTSKLNGEVIELNWSTSSEINFDYFSVQKSANGRDFAEIAQIKGNGTTSTVHNYKYEDYNPFIGKNYYRLTSVDFDNFQQVFKVLEQDYSGSKDLYISYSSDRSIVDLNFNFDAPKGALVIYDNIGYPVGSYEVSGVGTINLNNHFKTGIYVAKYSSGSFVKAVRFVIK